MRITFELDPVDLARFDEALRRAERRVACADACEIVDAARHALAAMPHCTPGFVRRRLDQVGDLIAMLEDEAWALPQDERAQVLRVLAYMGDPEDMIPDHVEIIGLLDDAIMLELLLRRLDRVIVAWRDFCGQREALGAPPSECAARGDWVRLLARQREALHGRMRGSVAGPGSA
ncbi:DUF1232 domain-containing protein [Coralloluteibacterium stylophorae]|uniref:DUF1232 domain-containing protein n=1 Tax=Coralloluteibacterium stylophorae TaxID=1776034 RepID=A0AAP2C8Z1_9GAMM|nr:DUF1232 domain-containing protein [Coralloluteibacterium stylophorae]MBS7456463.1 DUF1232 domain-containing protein [Coralloluteibacterium stylophorae]